MRRRNRQLDVDAREAGFSTSGRSRFRWHSAGRRAEGAASAADRSGAAAGYGGIAYYSLHKPIV